MTKKRQVVTRFAPSPTGYLHIGAARTALFNWLFARQNNGKFLLRIEDTDTERSKKKYETDILESLKWLGLSFDKMYRQSERTAVYKKYLEQLIQEDKAYISREDLQDPKTASGSVKKREEEGRGIALHDEVVRFKNPNKKIKFTDVILGDIEFDTTELGDFVIAKHLEEPLYNFTVVVDDHEMGITHVIRGQDHISNTPRQILIGEAIGFSRPVYAHIPLILAHDRSKLSKRHGAVSVLEFKKWGYLPEAFVNFLALIGWNPGDEREVFSLSQLVQEFSLDRVQKGGGVFNQEKLDWLNREHMKHLPQDIVINNIKEKILLHDFRFDEKIIKKIIPVVLERISKWSDLEKMVEEGELKYFFEKPEYDPKNLVWKSSTKKEAKKHLEKLQELLRPIAEDQFSANLVKEMVWDYAEREGRGDVLWPMRYALSGREKSPDPFTLAEIFGKEETLKRLREASDKLA